MYREPYGGRWLIIAALAIEIVEPTPYQRNLSEAHVLKLEKVIGKIKEPDITIVQEKLEKKAEQKTSVERRKLENTIALKKLSEIYQRLYSAEQTGFQVNNVDCRSSSCVATPFACPPASRST